MGFKKSKSFRILKQQGIIGLLSHISNKFYSPIKNKTNVFICINIYPKLILNKNHYNTYVILKKEYIENYKNIIELDSKFFKDNLKAHIEWVTSESFSKEYGNIKDIIKNNELIKSLESSQDNITPPPPLNTSNKTIDEINNQINTIKTKLPFSKIAINGQIYPPLLNPKDIDYDKIDWQIALELRLPTKILNFILFGYGMSGVSAMIDFLNRINSKNCKCNKFNNKNLSNYIHLDLCFKAQEIYECRILPSITTNHALILVRDPIIRLVRAVNHGYFTNEILHKQYITIDNDQYDICNNKGYFDEHGNCISNIPFIYNNFLEYMINVVAFSYYSNIRYLRKNVNIIYIDMQEIMPDKAFETMTNLAKTFNLALPKKNDVEFYKEIKVGKFSHLLPIKYVIELTNIKKVKIYISLKYGKNDKNIEINNMLFNEPLPLLDEISFSMDKDELELLKNDTETLQKVKDYMKKLIIELKKRTDYVQRNKKTEQDVLEVFRGDRDLRKKFKALLDKELVHIKEHRPDIIASWKYYLEFEEICREDYQY